MTESLFLLNYTPDNELIIKLAKRTGIEEAFIEKDWFNVQLLKSLSEFENNQGVELVFSGGTSLSKGEDIIKRFSEDLDFVLTSSEKISLGQRRSFRRSVIAHIKSDERFAINDDDVRRGDSNRYFKARIQYDKQFEHQSLRPYLQLEMTFADLKLPADKQDIQSMVSVYSKDVAETQMNCISPIETAGDKISALTWRVVVREESSKEGDPTMIRHLHDLASLKDIILKNQETFIRCARQSLEHDQRRRGGAIISGMSISERLEKACFHLRNQKVYFTDYQRFVQNMSYADDSDRISFEDAMSSLTIIIGLLQLKD